MLLTVCKANHICHMYHSWSRTGPMPPASVRFWSSKGTFWHFSRDTSRRALHLIGGSWILEFYEQLVRAKMAIEKSVTSHLCDHIYRKTSGTKPMSFLYKSTKYQLFYTQTSICVTLTQQPYLEQMLAFNKDMMTSPNGNIFRVTGHLCGEFIGPR